MTLFGVALGLALLALGMGLGLALRSQHMERRREARRWRERAQWAAYVALCLAFIIGLLQVEANRQHSEKQAKEVARAVAIASRDAQVAACARGNELRRTLQAILGQAQRQLKSQAHRGLLPPDQARQAAEFYNDAIKRLHTFDCETIAMRVKIPTKP